MLSKFAFQVAISHKYDKLFMCFSEQIHRIFSKFCYHNAQETDVQSRLSHVRVQVADAGGALMGACSWMGCYVAVAPGM
jgi:hypothetical protein